MTQSLHPRHSSDPSRPPDQADPFKQWDAHAREPHLIGQQLLPTPPAPCSGQGRSERPAALHARRIIDEHAVHRAQIDPTATARPPRRTRTWAAHTEHTRTRSHHFPELSRLCCTPHSRACGQRTQRHVRTSRPQEKGPDRGSSRDRGGRAPTAFSQHSEASDRTPAASLCVHAA